MSTDNPFTRDAEERVSQIERIRPRSKYPFDCKITDCTMRANNAFDVLYRGETLHFCSREHMILPWSVDAKKNKEIRERVL